MKRVNKLQSLVVANMNYETYKQMNKQQKEEYDYRFKNHPVSINARSILVFILIFMAMVQGLLVTTLLIYDEADRVPALKPYGDSIIQAVYTYLAAMIMVILILLVSSVIHMIIRGVMEHRWRKKHNIKYKG